MNKQTISSVFSSLAAERISEIKVFAEIDSTNTEAIRCLEQGLEGGLLVVSSAQTAGKGRRGRTWVSSANAGLYMSVALPFPADVFNLQAVSLITALAVQSAIAAQHSAQLELKWPNDVLIGNKKLAGILLERYQSRDLSTIVFGIGVNIKIPVEVRRQIDRPIIDLTEASGRSVDTELLCGLIADRLIHYVEMFCADGFAQFQPQWNELDRYLGDDIMIEIGGNRTIGQSMGVDEQGRLLLKTAEGTKVISTGEIFPSLKPAPDQR